ncbi:hypothetical protein [Burkholderia ambifaria]|jgi:hyperosmotically inducible protein|uniref:Uncharacterized protein n=1 Tax=Burkholderia ambifaria IOP40-10 TaxID=396596 RepID=B1F7K3_9BURK|nr:hypothetical protein [Burkholderia ambifaria]EDT06260.1 hypothetical protein BamIOP4010DRAFT_0012 [Burkholderia ambifaria IOP40-10]
MKRILLSHTSIRTALIAIGLVAGLGIGTTCFATDDSSTFALHLQCPESPA